MLTDISNDMPFGPKNLQSLFPQLDWANMVDYYIELIGEGGEVIVTTPLAVVDKASNNSGLLVLHFLNYAGRFDAVVFQDHSKTNKVKSDSWTKPLPFNPTKRDYGMIRSNIQANEKFTGVTIAYSEKEMKWLQELIESPLAFLQWSGTEGQPDDYLPVVITDKEEDTRKSEERYFYELKIEFETANEKISLKI